MAQHGFRRQSKSTLGRRCILFRRLNELSKEGRMRLMNCGYSNEKVMEFISCKEVWNAILQNDKLPDAYVLEGRMSNFAAELQQQGSDIQPVLTLDQFDEAWGTNKYDTIVEEIIFDFLVTHGLAWEFLKDYVPLLFQCNDNSPQCKSIWLQWLVERPKKLLDDARKGFPFIRFNQNKEEFFGELSKYMSRIGISNEDSQCAIQQLWKEDSIPSKPFMTVTFWMHQFNRVCVLLLLLLFLLLFLLLVVWNRSVFD